MRASSVEKRVTFEKENAAQESQTPEEDRLAKFIQEASRISKGIE